MQILCMRSSQVCLLGTLCSSSGGRQTIHLLFAHSTACVAKMPAHAKWPGLVAERSHYAQRLASRSSCWPGCAGLFLPTSDLDIVIINSGCRDVRGGLRALANALTRKGMAKQMQVYPCSALQQPLAGVLNGMWVNPPRAVF